LKEAVSVLAMEFPAIAIVIVLLLHSGRRITATLLFGSCGLSLVATIFVPLEIGWLRVLLNVLGRGTSNGCLCLCYVYSAEIYPTVIRNVGVGTSSFWVCIHKPASGLNHPLQARVGPMLAPYVAELAVYGADVPVVVFGVAALIASFFVTFLPETADHHLPDTLAEGEAAGIGDTLYAQMAAKRRKGKK